MERICKCGCGDSVGKFVQYIDGHRPGERKRHCRCGCGIEMAKCRTAGSLGTFAGRARSICALGLAVAIGDLLGLSHQLHSKGVVLTCGLSLRALLRSLASARSRSSRFRRNSMA